MARGIGRPGDPPEHRVTSTAGGLGRFFPRERRRFREDYFTHTRRSNIAIHCGGVKKFYLLRCTHHLPILLLQRRRRRRRGKEVQGQLQEFAAMGTDEQGLSPEQKDFFDSQGRAFSHAQSHEHWAASRSENLVPSLLVEDVTGSCS